VYSAFQKALPYVFPDMKGFWVIIIALVVAAALLLIYSAVIAGDAKRTLKQQLDDKISHLEQDVSKKDQELKDAFKIKKSVVEEGEEAIEYKKAE